MGTTVTTKGVGVRAALVGVTCVSRHVPRGVSRGVSQKRERLV